MEKGHYGKYTGNARHSRKEEMIHDREMIYDAKTQIHNEDKKYKETGREGYRKDMTHERELIYDTKGQIHKADSDYKGDSPAHLSYSSKFGGFSRADAKAGSAYTNPDNTAEIAAMGAKQQMLNAMGDSLMGNATDLMKTGFEGDMGEKAEFEKKRTPVESVNTGKEIGFQVDNEIKGGEVPTDIGKRIKTVPKVSVEKSGGGKLSSFDTAWEKDYDNIRTSGMYGGSDDAAKARYIADVGGQGETSDKANARAFAKTDLGEGVEYNPKEHSILRDLYNIQKSGDPNLLYEE